jgi:hypothetical protein
MPYLPYYQRAESAQLAVIRKLTPGGISTLLLACFITTRKISSLFDAPPLPVWTRAVPIIDLFTSSRSRFLRGLFRDKH